MKFTLPDKFYVRTPNVELYQLVQKQLFALGFRWNGVKKHEILSDLYYGNETAVANQNEQPSHLGYADDNYYQRKEYSEVSIADLFLAEPIKKETRINYLPWEVVIRGEKCDIGCQKNISMQQLVSFVNQINQADFAGSYSFGGFGVNLGRKGVFANGELIPWNTWDKFVEELNRIDKENSKG